MARKKTAPAATGAKAEIDLPYAIENGLKKEAADLTAKLLQETEAMNIVNDMLIPALDKAGAEFEKGAKAFPATAYPDSRHCTGLLLR